MQPTDRVSATVPNRFNRKASILLAMCAGLLAAPALLAAELTESEARGKLIYSSGESESNRVIWASISSSEAPSSASILPCMQCHGENGRGIGIVSPPVNWTVLTDPDGHEHPKRTHRPFDEASLIRAITRGVDPDGNDFEVTMPKYTMADEDMADLIAYLKVIDFEEDPAIAGGVIRVGTVLPVSGPHADLGGVMRSTIEGVFAEVNAAGGIHGRELELVVGGWGGNQDPQIWAAHDLVAKEPVIAMVSPYVPNYDAELETLAADKELPVVGPYTVLTPSRVDEDGDERENLHTFYLTAGLELQAEALVQAAAAKLTPAETNLVVVYPRVQHFDRLAETARQRARALGFASATDYVYALGGFDAQAAKSQLQFGEAGVVLFLGSAQELVQFGQATAATDWTPLLLAPGLLAERGVFNLPPAFGRNVLLAYASLPTDYSPEGSAEFEKLHEKYDFGYEFGIAQVSAYTAANVLVAGLEQAGRNLTRDELRAGLESLDDFHPGLVPPVSYDAFRRTGSVGVHIVPVDLKAGRFSEPVRWVVPKSAE
jgi:ABC-type branched-subunit amino acid transport system substrate-binding protein